MRYMIRAIDDDDGIKTVYIDASTKIEAMSQMKSQGYAVIAIKERHQWRNFIQKRSHRFPLAQFSQELLSLLDAGIPLVESIEALAEKEQQQDTKTILQQVSDKMYEGHPLSFALQQFPTHFPLLYIETVRASEKTSSLNSALARYVNYQLQMDGLRKKVISASIYPLLLLFAGSLVSLFLIGYVVPKFSLVYEQMGSDIPFFSMLLLNIGIALRNNGIIILISLLFAIFGFTYSIMRASNIQRLVQRACRITAIGHRIKLYQLARFYRTLGMLLQGGTPIITALQMASGLLQPPLRAKLALAANNINEGHPISRAMDSNDLTTPVASRMLTVGERSGRMGEMMDRIAAFYDEEIARWIEWFSKLFEPILMAAIGIAIGIIVVLMYFPIFELAGSIQ